MLTIEISEFSKKNRSNTLIDNGIIFLKKY